MNDLERIGAELRKHGPTIWAAILEHLPDFIRLVQDKRRSEIIEALGHAHASIARSRAAAEQLARERRAADETRPARIPDTGEGQ